MKKSVFILLFLLLPLASSLSINMQSSYKPGETILASLEGNFLSPISSSQVYFYSDRVQIPVTSDIARLESSKYYFYALLPNNIRNYSLIIKNIHYYENGEEKTEDLEKNFSVSGNITELSFSPGLFIAKDNFTIFVESKNKPITAAFKLLNQTTSAYIQPGKRQAVILSAAYSGQLAFLQLSFPGASYNIPVLVLQRNNTFIDSNYTYTNKTFRFSKADYNYSVNVNSSAEFRIYLINSGNTAINNIEINSSLGIVSISPSRIDSINPSDIKQIDLIINSKNTGYSKGKIEAKSPDSSVSSVLIVNTYSSGAVIPNETLENCYLLSGKTCLVGESCKGNIVDSSDGKCCIGGCEKKKSSAGWIIGIIILIAVLAGLFFLYKKMKSKKIESKDVLKKTEETFEKRFSNRDKEVKDRLSRS